MDAAVFTFDMASMLASIKCCREAHPVCSLPAGRRAPTAAQGVCHWN